MFKRSVLTTFWAIFAATIFATTQQVAVAADITVHDVYQAAEAGHMQQAQAMMQQVLREHPESAKAHYVEAELFAKSGQLDYARRELKTAQRLDPTLNFAKPAALEALQSRLNVSATSFGSSSSIPWGYLLLGVGLIAVLVMLIRAMSQRNVVQPVATPFGNAPPAYGGYPPGYIPGGGQGGGMGSGIMGGLATGAALGAGMVAGEALASHLIDGSHGGEHNLDESHRLAQDNQDGNANMGGDDFGINDNSSWDDAAGGDIGSDMGGDWG